VRHPTDPDLWRWDGERWVARGSEWWAWLLLPVLLAVYAVMWVMGARRG